MAKRAKAPPPKPMSPRTQQSPDADMLTGRANLMRAALGALIPAGGPIAGGDATQLRSETAKKARGKGR